MPCFDEGIAPGKTYEKVLGVNFVVLGEVVVLFGDEYALCGVLADGGLGLSVGWHTAEEVLVDLLAVGFGDEPEWIY